MSSSTSKHYAGLRSRHEIGGKKTYRDEQHTTRAQSQRYVAPKHGARAYNYVTFHRMLDLCAVGTSDGGQGP